MLMVGISAGLMLWISTEREVKACWATVRRGQMLSAWSTFGFLKRIKEERVSVKEECEFGWEWELGFRTGLHAFEKSVGLS